MRYLELAPTPRLRQLIRCYWFLSGSSPEPGAAPEPALPDGSAELILNLAAPFVAAGSAAPQPVAMLVGQITGPFGLRPTGPIDIVGVRFEPFGARALFPDQATLTDRIIPAADLPRARLGELWSQLAERTSPPDRARRIDRHLVRHLPLDRSPDRQVVAAVDAIRVSHGAVSLGALLGDLRLTARNLQRRFATEVGLSPKRYARICRFQHVFASWRSQPGSWARTAAHCGYFDQSHLVRDFRELAGFTPAELVTDGPEFSRIFTDLRRPRSPGPTA